jgi:hypothetical protein
VGEGENRKEIGLKGKLNLKDAQTHEMSLGVFNCRSCVALTGLFVAQNPFRRQLCKYLNLRVR